MKKTLVIVVHPTLSTSTINKAWSEAACGHATLHFLYRRDALEAIAKSDMNGRVLQ